MGDSLGVGSDLVMVVAGGEGDEMGVEEREDGEHGAGGLRRGTVGDDHQGLPTWVHSGPMH